MKPYIEDIIDHFYTLPYAEIDPATLHQVRRSFLDYYGCALYTANAACCKELVALLLDLGAQGNYPIWGESRRGNVVSAAAANACRISNIEMDDGSGINAAVHPGLYVWTGALAAFQEKPCSIEQLMKAILFGYDVCMRMGMLSAKTVSQYELHGPGLSGAFGTVAAAGMVLGLSKEQLLNAFGIAGALLPLCPFISFIDGVDAKDLYGGWGVYLAMMAIEATKRGLTGSKQIMDGTKSLKVFYSDSRGKDTALGTPYYINVIGFKEFATCLAAHPALICAEKIMHENDFTAEAITRVDVHVNMEALMQVFRLPLHLQGYAFRMFWQLHSWMEKFARVLLMQTILIIREGIWNWQIESALSLNLNLARVDNPYELVPWKSRLRMEGNSRLKPKVSVGVKEIHLMKSCSINLECLRKIFWTWLNGMQLLAEFLALNL